MPIAKMKWSRRLAVALCTIQMTANIYGHLDVQRKQLLTKKMAASIF